MRQPTIIFLLAVYIFSAIIPAGWIIDRPTEGIVINDTAINSKASDNNHFPANIPAKKHHVPAKAQRHATAHCFVTVLPAATTALNLASDGSEIKNNASGYLYLTGFHCHIWQPPRTC